VTTPAPWTDALTWAGTYHGIGARLLREYAEQIGLDPAFTIHDREDSADLMNLVRHEKGFSKTESRFPTKGTCLSIYSRCVNAEMPIEQVAIAGRVVVALVILNPQLTPSLPGVGPRQCQSRKTWIPDVRNRTS
jgi:hypothetical protein